MADPEITDVTGARMALIPAGSFLMGTRPERVQQLMSDYGIRRSELFAPEMPQHAVSLDAYYMDVHPVTNAQFRAFVEAEPDWSARRIPGDLHNGNYLSHWTEDEFPTDRADHPVVNVCWYAAVAYARWANKRLPAEAEWERAARGGRVDEEFPWGDQPVSTDLANYAAGGHGETMSIGSYPPNGYGLQDMSGNVWEYCLDEWQPDYTGRSPLAANDKEQAGLEFLSVRTRRVIRGGSWSGLPVNLRVAWRDSHPPGGAGDHVGFRCVASLAPE